MTQSPTANPSQHPANSLRRWTLRIFATGLMCFGIAWLIQMLLLPWIVRRQVVSAFDRLGFPHATFTVRQASLTSAEVADIRAGDDQTITLNRITVTYSPLRVIQGHVNTVVIAGAEIQLAVGGGKSLPISKSGHASSGGSMPFDRIEVRSSTLKLDWEDRHFWLPVDAAIDANSTGQLTLAIRTFFRGVEVPITGTLSSKLDNFDLKCKADDIGLAGLVSAFPQHWTKSIPALSGTVKLDIAARKSAGDLQLDLLINGPDAQVHASSAILHGPSAQLHFAGTTDEHGTTINVTKNSTVGISSVELGNTRSEPVALLISEGPLVARTASDSVTIAMKLQTAKPTSLNIGSLNMSVATIGVDATVAIQPTTQPTIHGAVAIGNASMIDADSKLELHGISGAIPFAWNVQPTESGKISITDITLDGTPLPPPSAGAKFVDGKLDATMLWEPISGAKLTATATASRGKAGWQAQVAALAPSFVISDPKAWRSLVKSRGDMDITGTFALDAKLDYANGRLRPHARLQVQKGAISSKQYDFDVTGLSADMNLWRLWPVATNGSQVIKAASARIGKMTVTDGIIQCRISDPHSIFIEQTSWAWAGGRLYSYAVQLDPAKPAVDLTLYADNLSVGELLHFSFPEHDVKGQGTVYGRLPAKIRWPGIQFGDGFLYSTPGNGQLSLGSESQTVAEMVAGSGEGSNEVKNQLRGQLVQDLQQFRYDLLKVDFVNKKDGMTASVQIKGKGQTGGTPLDITFNVNGVDLVFRNVLVIKKLMESISK